MTNDVITGWIIFIGETISFFILIFLSNFSPFNFLIEWWIWIFISIIFVSGIILYAWDSVTETMEGK